MPLIISIFLLILTPLAYTQTPTNDFEKNAEIYESAENIRQILNFMLLGTEQDGVQELQKKLGLIKSIKKEMGEKDLLRFELMDAVGKIQLGIQSLRYQRAQGSTGTETTLSMLKKIETTLETADQKWVARFKIVAESGKMKGALSSLRSAIQVFYGDKEGVFPNDLSKLTERSKYITQIPHIMPPGHTKRSNSVKNVSGVRTMEELIKQVDDEGGWLYVNDRSTPMWGTIVINCNHKDIQRDTYIYSY